MTIESHRADSNLIDKGLNHHRMGVDVEKFESQIESIKEKNKSSQQVQIEGPKGICSVFSCFKAPLITETVEVMLAGCPKNEVETTELAYLFESPTANFTDASSDILRVKINTGRVIKSIQSITISVASLVTLGKFYVADQVRSHIKSIAHETVETVIFSETIKRV